MAAQRYDEYLKPAKRGKGDAAIVFVHGFSGNITATWGDFPTFVRETPQLRGWDVFTLGYDTSLIPDIRALWSGDASLEELGLWLRTALLHQPFTEYGGVALVAHSMGGLVVQRALLDTDARQRVSHVFLFGTPSGGLWKAWLFRRLKPQLEDMAPTSEFLAKLRDGWTSSFPDRTPFQFWAVAGETDEFVPSDTAHRPFPEDRRFIVPGNHLQIVKPTGTDALSFKLLTEGLIGDPRKSEAWNAARAAVQTTRSRDTVHQLWDRRAMLDQEALVKLALALDRLGRREDAIAMLRQHAQSTDALGTLGGRLKRRWLAQRAQRDAEDALALYNDGLARSEREDSYKADQAYYHAVNVAFMEIAYRQDRAMAEKYARRALEHCERHAATKPDNEDHITWRIATEAEARLVLGDNEMAIERYRESLRRASEPWQVTSTYEQAMLITERIGTQKVADRLTEVFRTEVERST